MLTEVVGVHIEKETETHDYAGLKLAFGPKILLDPTFAFTLNELKQKFAGVNRISKGSNLILKGHRSTVSNLTLNGVLRVENGMHATGEVSNEDKVEFTPALETDDEVYRMRGYKPKH